MTTTNCVFDWCALWNGLGLGVLGSLVASGFIYCIIRWRDRRIYGTAEGVYKGYEYEKSELVKNGQVEVAELRGLNLTKATSTARIKYNYVNVLEITVQSTDGNSVWCGTITMQSANSGVLVWRYVTPHRDEHHFGFKRCLVRGAGDTVWVYLLGENGYGGEAFRREKRRTL